MMRRSRIGGQTLIIALLILGVLLIVGFVFLGLISRNIATQVRSNQRSVGNDLAEAGVRYAHGQLLRNSADWRIALTPGVSNRDPDYELLKAGGPDGLGNYGRVNFDQGRALVRVRYGPSDVNVFSTSPTGPLRLPGRAKNFVIIESVGKPGKANPTDPTTALDARGERERLQTRKLIAFASLGITEQAFFVTNKNNVSRPIDFGIPTDLGARYDDRVGAVSPFGEVRVPMQLGDLQFLPNPGGGLSIAPVPYGGSAWFNGDVNFHGELVAYLNKYFGDSINATGSVVGVDDVNSVVRLRGANVVAGNWAGLVYDLQNLGANSLDSRSPNFLTGAGMFRDGFGGADREGNTRSMRRKEPPSFLAEDPSTNESIYRQMARESGIGQSGQYGHGRSIYVNNLADRQNRIDEQGREIQETNESLAFDWLNPNNGQAGSGWRGAFYVPRGAFVQLVPDGFIILRDSGGPANERTWRDATGADTSNSVNRFRIVRNGAGKLFIANTYTNFGGGVTINTATPAQVASAGTAFDGVLFFEGNVRVRGTIPTDVPVTLVSGGSIYIEGSITKGVVRTQASYDQGGPLGQRITTSSRSMLMLAAKDFVVLNTSQFFGLAPTQVIEEVNDLASASEYNPIRMRSQNTPGSPSSYNFRTENVLDPETVGGNPANPSLWKPYSASYQEYGTALTLRAGLLVTHTMDDGPATNSFLSMDVNYGLDNAGTANNEDWKYLFDLNRTPAVAPINLMDPYQQNNASDYAPFNVPGYTEVGYGAPQQDRGSIYGIGAESWQRYGKFETTFFPLTDSNGTGGAYAGFPSVPITPEHGSYMMLAQETNEFNLRFNTIGSNASNDYLVARAAMVPNDVRIEASVYAEDGSFFVIPSPWFNPNPNDRRDTYLARIAAVGVAQAQAERYQNYGAAPITPFYGEPIDVRVRIVGAVSENMPAPMSQQAEWVKKWGWIPRSLGDVRNGAGNNVRIPAQHVPTGYDLTTDLYVPNLIISYDPALGSGRAWDPTVAPSSPFNPLNPAIRVDDDGRMLPPMPKLPVSPTLAYFGEVNQ